VRKRALRLSLIAAGTVALAVLGQSSAMAACPALDATCLADEVVGTGEDVVYDTTEPVDTPVDGTVDPLIKDVFDRTHDLVGGDPIDPPDPIGEGDGGGHDGSPPPAYPHPGGRGAVDGRGPDGPGLTRTFDPIISEASGIARPRQVDRTFGERFEDALGGVARSLAIVLALFGLALAFVTVQDRLDRNDPRLALAPVESDVVEFA
jgi:hypothetical protein